MDQNRNKHDVRVLYFGTTGAYSVPPLEALLEAGVDVCAVVVPGPPTHPRLPKADIIQLHPPVVHSSLPVINPFVNNNIVHLAWERGIPVYEIHQLRSPKTLDLLTAQTADIGCVACFPWRLPPALLNLLPYGWLNIHPSLLPAYRGPAPLFWIMRDGIEAAGVTIHRMDVDFDTGDIAAQAVVSLPDGIDGVQADHLIARRGGELLIPVLRMLEQNTVVFQKQHGAASAAPWPTVADFQVDQAWTARRAFNFMRGTANWQLPYHLVSASRRRVLVRAIGYTPNETLQVPVVELDDCVRIQFADGVLDAEIADPRLSTD